jgi:hypothetical protein
VVVPTYPTDRLVHLAQRNRLTFKLTVDR